MTAASETPSPARPDTTPAAPGAPAGLGPHTHPVSDPSLPHQIILIRSGNLDETAVSCNCLAGKPVPLAIGIGPAGDPAELLRIYRQHVGIM